MEQAINSLLEGVTEVPKCAANLGTLVVFESNAYPILTADSTCSVVLAAAEIGQGRVFVASHEAYLDNFLAYTDEYIRLWRNVKSWLAKGQYVRNEDIRSIDAFDSVQDIPEGVRIVKWLGACSKTELFVSQLLKKYVMNGGSVLCAACPSAWLSQSHGTKLLDEMSLNKFLSLCGICFAADVCATRLERFSVRANLALYAHCGNSISLLARDMNEAVSARQLIVNGLSALPCQAAGKHLEKLHKILYTYICAKYKPTSRTSVTCPVGRALLAICAKMYQKFSACGIRVRAPNIEEFPGAYAITHHQHQQHPHHHSPSQHHSQLPILSEQSSAGAASGPVALAAVVVAVKSKFDEFHCTGYYMAAGSTIHATVLDGNPAGWELRVSCHTDDLSDMASLKRWPLIYSTVKLKKATAITSAFGGLVYLDSPKGNSSIRVRLENVIEAPFFDLAKPDTHANWPQRSAAPGLWAELSGKHITFTVPSHSIRSLDDPAKALQLWDLIVVANHELRGTDPFNTWRERVVVDIQPNAGLIHSGYPIVLSYDYIKPDSPLFLFDPAAMRAGGAWNLAHELAHNMQRACWTPTGTEEVTGNIFALHALDLVFRQRPLFASDSHGSSEATSSSNASSSCSVLREQLESPQVLASLRDDSYSYATFAANPHMGLLMYAQLVNAFGWNAFKTIFREYESLTDQERIFRSDTDKWDQWICRFSNIVGLDVSPLFYFWAVPFSAKPGTNLSDLTPWLPDDELTRMHPARVSRVRSNYSGLLLGSEALYTSCPKEAYADDFVFDSVDKLNSLKLA